MTTMPKKKRPAAMTPEEFSAILEREGLTVRAAAAILKVGHATVARWANGDTPIAHVPAQHIRVTFPEPKPKR